MRREATAMQGETVFREYINAISNTRLPLAFVDLDRFDANVDYVAATQINTGKTIRIGSKSVRCISLLKRIFDIGGNAYQGILAFTVEEAGFLVRNGFDDIIIAYPSVQTSDMKLLAEMSSQKKTVSLMVDCQEQLDKMSETGKPRA